MIFKFTGVVHRLSISEEFCLPGGTKAELIHLCFWLGQPFVLLKAPSCLRSPTGLDARAWFGSEHKS
ncbi:MAG: hypothetical protein CMN98_01125 [Synechococcus sp. NP17]|nr:hypothetical protein [Synechococcus sp. NP17]